MLKIYKQKNQSKHQNFGQFRGFSFENRALCSFLWYLVTVSGFVLAAGMFWPLSVLSLAVFWLAHRIYTLAKVPLPDLIKVLNIDIPRATKISIDNITDKKVYLHWDLPSAEDRIVNFVLFVNGIQASVLSGTESHCFVTKLIPDTKYKLDLVCINNRGFKAKSDSIYIKTKSTELVNYADRLLLENPENLFRLLTDNKANTTTVHKVVNSNSEARATRSRSNTVNSITNENATANGSIHGLPDPLTVDNIEELRYYLESGQEELHNVLRQQQQSISDFQEQEAMLIDERDKLRERKRLEDGNRQAMKSEIKMLDESRRLTELRKSKQENILATKLKLIAKMERELEEWNLKIDEFEDQKVETENSEEKIYNELDADIEGKRSVTKGLQSHISRMDEQVKTLNMRKKQLEQIKAKTQKLLRALQDHTDQGGCIDAEGLKNLDSLFAIDEDAYTKIKKEIDIDIKLEAEWRAQQQREVNHCLKVAKAHEALKIENNSLKNGWIPQNEGSSISPPTTDSSISLTNQSQAVPFSIPITSGSSIGNFAYNNFVTESSPSLTSLQLHAQNQATTAPTPPFQIPSVWNSYSPPANNALLINTSKSNPSDEETHEIDSPSVNRFLPTNLIGDDFADLLDVTKTTDLDTEQNISADANGSSMNPNTFSSLLNESTANLSTRSIFHGDFGIASPPRFSLEAPSSPTQSYHNEFLSAQNSSNANDIHSVLSGKATIPLPPSQSEAHKEGYLNSLSPRRLSNVFSFGNKPKIDNSIDHPSSAPPPVSSSALTKQQSKFFHKSGGSKDSSNGSSQPFFTFNHADQSTDPGVFHTFDSLWQGSSLKNNSHNRSISIKSSHSNTNLEKDTESWAKFHFGNGNELEDGDGESLENELGVPVALTNTNKSSNTGSVKSIKSTSDPTSSPSFFRKKIFTFGNNNQSTNVDKSPTKNGIFQTNSQSKEFDHDESAIDDLPIQRKLFSRNRKTSSSAAAVARKQSNSSSFEGLSEGVSIQSNSTTNSRSIVRKLSFFGSKNGTNSNHKDIEDIYENNEDESSDGKSKD